MRSGPCGKVSHKCVGNIAKKNADKGGKIADSACCYSILWSVHAIEMWRRCSGCLHTGKTEGNLTMADWLDLTFADHRFRNVPEGRMIEQVRNRCPSRQLRTICLLPVGSKFCRIYPFATQ